MSATNSSLSGGGAKPLVTTSIVPQVHDGSTFVAAQASVDTSVADAILLTDGTRIDTGVLVYKAHGFTVGQYYWLSQTTVGAVTPIKPTSGWTQRLFFVEDADTIIVDVEPAYDATQPVTTTQASFMQVLAAGTVTIGDPVPAGNRPVVSYLNLASATGLDTSAADARLQVTFTNPLPSANYKVSHTLRSVAAANWNNDNDVSVPVIVSQSTTGFVVAFKETNSVTQNLHYDFSVELLTTATAANMVTPEVTALVPLNTPVTIDNLRIEARLTGGQGFRVGTVAGTMLVNISAVTSYAQNAVYGSNVPNITLNTTMTHPAGFGWTGQSNADAMTGTIYDRTNNRVYEFTLMTNQAPVLSYIRIKRTM